MHCPWPAVRTSIADSGDQARGLVAVREIDPAEVRSGSFASLPQAARLRRMSAMPSIATEWWCCRLIGLNAGRLDEWPPFLDFRVLKQAQRLRCLLTPRKNLLP